MNGRARQRSEWRLGMHPDRHDDRAQPRRLFPANNMTYQVVAFEKNEEVLKAYQEGRCDVYTTDQSGIYAERLKLPNPTTMWCCPRSSPRSRSARLVRQGDDAGSTSSNGPISRCSTPRSSASPRPECRGDEGELRQSGDQAAAGKEGDFGTGLGLTNDWVDQIVKGVGNYGEIFERNVGESTHSRSRAARTRCGAKAACNTPRRSAEA